MLLQSSTASGYLLEQNSTWKTCKNLYKNSLTLSHKKEKKKKAAQSDVVWAALAAKALTVQGSCERITGAGEAWPGHADVSAPQEATAKQNQALFKNTSAAL